MTVFTAYKGYEGTADIDLDTFECRGKILFIDDLVTFKAESPKLLEKEFHAAVDDYLTTCETLGRDPQRPCKGQFQVRIAPDLHRAALLRASAEKTSLNDIVARSVDCYLNGQSEVNHRHFVFVEMEAGSLDSPFTTMKAMVAEGAETNRVHH
ncbi:type II toxin-antitoxin system HicB family antitoxin [Dyella jejuensis]|uniref:Type II toxin-antitoxin system HicB family antitoxin n=1 Tax=Dyella jejuensis TaxID=1432009 RepID=A0ABW8JIU4_9GAMM